MEKLTYADIKSKKSPEVDESEFGHALSIATLIQLSRELQAAGMKTERYKRMELEETKRFLDKIAEGILPNEAIELLDKQIIFAQEDTVEDQYYYNPDEQVNGWRE